MDKFDVIIIGSGLGGLLCGYILSKEGFNVCILEKQRQPGGNLQTFTRLGNKFETGVHYIGSMGPGQTLNRYWKYFGLTDVLELQQLDRDGFDIVGYDDSEFPLAQGFDNFIERLAPLFPGGRSSLISYIRRTEEVVSAFPLYNLQLPDDHREHHYTTHSARDFYQQASVVRSDPAGIPLSSVLAGNNFLYAGSPLTPLHVSSLINHSFISGAYRIIGGSDLISRHLVSAVKAQGGTILTRKEVKTIEPLGPTFSISTSRGDVFLSHMIISDIHPAATLSLIPQETLRSAYQKRIASLKNTASSFILYLSLKPGAFPYLNYNYYFHASGDPWKEASGKENWPEMFLLSTACHKKGQEFAETATVMTYMQYDEFSRWADTCTGSRGREYLAFRDEKAGRLLDTVSKRFPGLKKAITGMEISTPLTYRDFAGSPEGSLYGIQKDFNEPLMTTVMPRTKIPNFYFTGQNTNLHGVVGVTIGSVVTCGEILGLDYLLKKIKDA